MTDISIKPIHGPHTRDISALSDVLQITPLQLAADLYTLCRWMQENQHYGVSQHTIKHANEQLTNNGNDPLPDYLLELTYLGDVYEGMLYYSEHRKYSGWGINKNDVIKSEKYEVWKWEQTWLEKFAYLHPHRGEAIQNRLDAIAVTNERKPKRKHDLHWLENKPTVEIAHLRELSKVMEVWMWSFKAIHGLGDDSFTYLQNMWAKQVIIYTQELEYRTAADPEPRASKKKTEAAKKDFREAPLWITGANKIYSDEFVETVKRAAMPFDLSVDYDNLPKQPPEDMPVMKMGYYDLMHEFMRWVSANEIDPDSFEGEDAELLKQKLRSALHEALNENRKALARAKNQHVPVEEIDS